MLYSRQAVRDNIRNRDGRRVFYLGKGDQLTSDARDYLTRERIDILPAEEARPRRYALLGGGYMEDKPEHMTHLDAQLLVPKTHPRIRFRGVVDMLEAELLLCAAEVEVCRKELSQVLALARRLIACDVLGEPVGEEPLCGLTQQELRERSHRPQDFYGKPHFMPEVTDGRQVLLLNRARCAARQAELAAVAAFSDRDAVPTRPDILLALNRMSSMLYILMLQCKNNG